MKEAPAELSWIGILSGVFFSILLVFDLQPYLVFPKELLSFWTVAFFAPHVSCLLAGFYLLKRKRWARRCLTGVYFFFLLISAAIIIAELLKVDNLKGIVFFFSFVSFRMILWLMMTKFIINLIILLFSSFALVCLSYERRDGPVPEAFYA